MNKRNVIAALKLARQLLVEYGWIQGSFGDRSCGFCAMAAIASVNTSRETEGQCRILLRKAAGTKCLVTWNDARSRTKRQVLGLFQRTITGVERG